jgi:hypothetical protein
VTTPDTGRDHDGPTTLTGRTTCAETRPSVCIACRLFKGVGLGAALLDWVSLDVRNECGQVWIRVSAWTNNTALYTYYQRQGFPPSGFHPDGCQSAASLPEPTALI